MTKASLFPPSVPENNRFPRITPRPLTPALPTAAHPHRPRVRLCARCRVPARPPPPATRTPPPYRAARPGGRSDSSGGPRPPWPCGLGADRVPSTRSSRRAARGGRLHSRLGPHARPARAGRPRDARCAPPRHGGPAWGPDALAPSAVAWGWDAARPTCGGPHAGP